MEPEHPPWARFDDLHAGTAVRCPRRTACSSHDVPRTCAPRCRQSRRRPSRARGPSGTCRTRRPPASTPTCPVAGGRGNRPWCGSACATSPFPSPRSAARGSRTPLQCGARTGPTPSTPRPWRASGSTSQPARPISATSPTGCVRPSQATRRGSTPDWRWPSAEGTTPTSTSVNTSSRAPARSCSSNGSVATCAPGR
jgi:hypothetical protein